MTAPTDVVGIGYVALDRIYVDGLPAQEFLGGTCGNVLYVLAALGRSVSPVAELGDNPSSGILFDILAKRGARTRHLTRTKGLATPSIIENLDSVTRKHSFSFTDPDTGRKLQRWHEPARADMDAVLSSVRACRVLFVDRLSDHVVEAMRAACNAGAIVVFEPQEIGDRARFAEALRHAHVVKCSRERMTDMVGTKGLREDLVMIVTAGEAGLDVYRGFRRISVPARKADLVIDTCGSGDMTTAGLVDGLLTLGRRPAIIEDVMPGIVAGRNLAAAGCGQIGALGLVRFLGRDDIRHVMREGTTRRTSPLTGDAAAFDDPSLPLSRILDDEAEALRRFLDDPSNRPSRMHLARLREILVAVGTRLEATGRVRDAKSVLPLGDGTKPVRA